MGRENKNIPSQLYMPFKINIIALERGDASAPLQMFCAAKQTRRLKIMLTVASKETNGEAFQSHCPCSSKADSPFVLLAEYYLTAVFADLCAMERPKVGACKETVVGENRSGMASLAGERKK